MTKPIPGIKIPYFLAEQYPDDIQDFRCVEVHIPDDPVFMALLGGLLRLPARAFNWQGATYDKRLKLAAMWRDAYDFNCWEECMKCEDLIECLQPLFDAQTEQITNNLLNLQQYGTQNPGQPMTPEQSAADIAAGTNPTCNYDILWAQCLAIIQFTNRAITDTLEIVEAATNVVELADLINTIPILQLLSENSGFETVTQAINYFQNAVAESYNAQYTEEVEIQLACQLFCLCRDDCQVTVDRLYDMTVANLGSLLPSDPGDLVDLVEIVAGIDFDGTEVVDVCFFFAWGSAKLAQFLFGTYIPVVKLQTLLDLAVNDANNDWELLCDCPEEWCVSLTGGNGLDTIFAPYVGGPGIQAEWSGTGWRATAAVPGRITLEGDFVEILSLTKVEILCTVEITVGTDKYQQFSNAEGGLNLFEDATEISTFEMSDAIRYTFLDRVPSTGDPLTPACPGEIYEIRLYGFGTPPELGEPCE